MKILITLVGCDDETEIPIEVNEEERKLIQKISDKSRELKVYGCQPIMTVEDIE
jgi:hypothetical protein